MKLRSFEKYWVGIACILVAFGDVRFIITPLGYWLSWLLWGGIAAVLIFIKGDRGIETESKIIIIGFAVMLIGIMLSAAISQSIQTAYQGFKLLVIACMGICILKTCKELDSSDVSIIAGIVVLISFMVFLVSKYFFTPLYLVLGDGRQGSLFAAPGTLWKAGYFFSLLALSVFFK